LSVQFVLYLVVLYELKCGIAEIFRKIFK